jgi:hypothetical protein
VAADTKPIVSASPAPGPVSRARLHAKPLDRRCSPSDFMRHRHAWQVGRAIFTIASHDGKRVYLVGVSQTSDVICSCSAGLASRPCVHACADLRRVLRELRRG